MLKYRIRHLPVVEKDKLIGLVSMRDVVEILLDDKESIIKGLENYILGSGFAT
ncbi:MAG: CBS domain-containing protein [Anaerolineae bacterium]